MSTETSAPTQTPEPTLTPAATETLAPTITLMPTLGVGSSIESRGVTMMYVPAGNFVMGNGSGREEVKPAHTVYLGAFYMDQYEVTNAAYKRCVDSNGCGAPQSKGSFNIPSYYENSIYADYPVLFVSWPQAKQYCEWRGMRLPTEAEWEKAARGETGNRTYPWKGAFDGTKLNFCDKNCPVSKEADKNVDDGYANIAPVGSYEEGKSPYGIYDLAGNVWEWIADWYDAKYYFTSPVENPLGPNAGQDRVLRGGAWNTNKNETQSFYRIGKNPLTAYYDIGFRCAADANP
ncbi:MAG: formylglycine-generating enzyme family protein [Anaerolineales bacterium]|nr:formylglycine-generating enzyme family protein [Anaerolineales bacterium]